WRRSNIKASSPDHVDSYRRRTAYTNTAYSIVIKHCTSTSIYNDMSKVLTIKTSIPVAALVHIDGRTAPKYSNGGGVMTRNIDGAFSLIHGEIERRVLRQVDSDVPAALPYMKNGSLRY